jgi:hypothetical protein
MPPWPRPDLPTEGADSCGWLPFRCPTPRGAPGTQETLADPVFVLCGARTGSTLLRFLLDAHPALARRFLFHHPSGDPLAGLALPEPRPRELSSPEAAAVLASNIWNRSTND